MSTTLSNSTGKHTFHPFVCESKRMSMKSEATGWACCLFVLKLSPKDTFTKLQ